MVMLHFHIGSQITDIRKIKEAIREAGRVYAKLRALGVPIQYLNLGGGLGVDYDGSKTAFDSSMNYSVQEYANDVVYTIKQICDEEKVPAPILVTESGRAVTAYHSVFVTNVLDVADRIEQGRRVHVTASDATVLQELASIFETVNAKTLRESYHDALQYKEELFTLFNLGHLSLEDRSKGEILFWQICERIHKDLKTLKEIPEEFEDMETMLADKYVLNFSVFQSLPDVWAIDQLFPILPIHRLNERPTEFGTLADITCDSDGKIEKFIDLRDIKETLPLHALQNGEPYYIGVCLMGAYQDVLGDLHNLFGEAHEVLVTVDEEGQAHIDGRAAGRVLRARPRVHELRPDRDPRLHRPAAAPRGRPAAEEGRGAGDLQGVRGGLPAVHVPRAMRRLVRAALGIGLLALPCAVRAAQPAGGASGSGVARRRLRGAALRDAGGRRAVARPHRGSLEGNRERVEPPVPLRRGVPRHDPRRRRPRPPGRRGGAVRRDGRPREAGRLLPRLPGRRDGHRRAPQRRGGALDRRSHAPSPRPRPCASTSASSSSSSSRARSCGFSSGAATRSSPEARSRDSARASGGRA